jgi:hypothetical protein
MDSAEAFTNFFHAYAESCSNHYTLCFLLHSTDNVIHANIIEH